MHNKAHTYDSVGAFSFTAALCSAEKFPAPQHGAGRSPFHFLYVPGGEKGDRKLSY